MAVDREKPSRQLTKTRPLEKLKARSINSVDSSKNWAMSAWGRSGHLFVNTKDGRLGLGIKDMKNRKSKKLYKALLLFCVTIGLNIFYTRLNPL